MKVVIIGTGFGRYAMAPVYKKLGFEVDVISPRDADAVAKALAAGPDLVSVHSAPFLHHDHVMQALEGGAAVLCDKPFGRNGAEARAMRDRAKALGRLNFLNFEVRETPTYSKIKQLVEDGAIGAPRHMSWVYFGDGFRNKPYGWINEAEKGGGWIGAYASHGIDMMRWIFGSEVAKCGGMTRVDVPVRKDAEGKDHPTHAEDAYAAWFVMQNGCTGSADTGFSSPVSMTTRVTLMGEEGGIELYGDNEVVLRQPGGKTQVFDCPETPGTPLETALTPWLTRVREALKTGVPTTPSFDDGVAVAEVMDQLRANSVAA